MSDTSARKKSKATESGSQPTTLDLLAMLQAMLAKVGDAPGIRVDVARLYDQGGQAAGIIISGAHWDGENLVPNAGNAGKEGRDGQGK